MSVQIRIIPEEVRNIASTQKTIAETIGNNVKELSNASSVLSNAWDSAAALQMMNIIEQIEEVLKSLNDQVFEGASGLVEIANLFESIDANLDASVSVAKRIDPILAIKKCPLVGAIAWDTSSSGTIRIIPDDVRHVGELCNRVSTECQDIMGQWNSTFEQLQSVWEGNAANKYYSTSREVEEGLRDVSAAMDELANRLRMIADRYEEIDNMMF